MEASLGTTYKLWVGRANEHLNISQGRDLARLTELSVFKSWRTPCGRNYSEWKHCSILLVHDTMKSLESLIARLVHGGMRWLFVKGATTEYVAMVSYTQEESWVCTEGLRRHLHRPTRPSPGFHASRCGQTNHYSFRSATEY